ncbi:MAG TPA: glycosyltransferase family 4 protein [Terriglobia bacterium]|nr:glycosyltransferase family 4 protein [Terriglobia bacterium]
MRILILTPDIYTRGGIARYTSALASTLGDLIGAENVHVQPLLGTDEPCEGSYQCRVFNPVAEKVGIQSKIKFVCKALALAVKRYSLVISTHVGLAPVAAIIRHVFGTPFWVVCHGSESWQKFPADVRWALRNADWILPVSRFTADTVAKMNGLPSTKVRVLHNAIPDSFARMLMDPCGSSEHGPRAADKVRTILSVGMVSRELSYKGFDTVIAALPRVLDRVPDARYVIAGGGDDVSRLKQFARETGVLDHVVFRGTLSDTGLAECYRTCDVFILPSRAKMSPPCKGEGFGRVYVEAALAGKPVVGSTAGGAAESVLHQRTGLLVDPESISDVSRALIYILENPEAAARMGREARRWASANFTSRALRRPLEELLRDYGFLLSSEPPTSPETMQFILTTETDFDLSTGPGIS